MLKPLLRPPPSRLRAVPLAVLALAVPVAGCGSSSSGASDADPAGAVPAGTPLYAEVVARPEGKLRDDATAAARKVLQTPDPGAQITKLVDRALKDSKASYAKNVEPWLGKRVALALTSFKGANGDPDIVVLAASKDDDKAYDALKDKGGISERTFRGVKYRFDPDGAQAAGVVAHTLVIGSERAFKSVVDADKSGRTLAADGKLKAARGRVSGDGLAFLYVDPASVLDAVGGLGGLGGLGSQLPTLQGALPQGGLGALGVGITAAADAIRIETASPTSGQAAAAQGTAAKTLAGLPAGSAVAVGLGDLGATLGQVLTGVQATPAGALLGQLRSVLGVDIQRDLLSWMGDGGIFVRGGTPSQIGGALVVASKDAAKSRSAITKIRTLVRRFGGGGVRVSDFSGDGVRGLQVRLRGFPFGIFVASRASTFVVAVGRPALTQALTPSATLADDPAFKTAAGQLAGGVKPALYVDLRPIVAFLALGAGSDPSFIKAKPYLDAFTTLVAGAGTQGKSAKAQLAVGLK